MNRIMSTLAATCVTSANNMPPIGLGTLYMARSLVPQALHHAIAAGYRRIDCAPVYFNEDAVGDALAKELDSGTIKREDLYIVSKLPSPFHKKQHVELALRKTLTDLRLDYLDLYLIHWPVAFQYVHIDPNVRGYENEDIDDSDGGKRIDPDVSIKETWSAIEDLVDKGLVKNVGVSNFPVSLLHEVMAGKVRYKPVVNQVEIHPYLQQSKLLAYCQARGVHVQAYSPLGSPGYKEEHEPSVLEDPVLKEIANSKQITVPQLCLAWSLQRNCSVVVKSTDSQRQVENLVAAASTSGEVVLSDEDMKRIADLDRGYRYFRPEEWWGSMAMAVFN